MPRYTRVDVTQEDIDKAFANDSARCVVAQAVARTIPHSSRVSVDIQTVRYTDSRGVRRVYLTPVGVEQYIIAFDAGDPIEPFSFGLYETQRVNTPRKPKTSAGKKKDAARAKVRDAKAKVAELDALEDATPAQRAVAAEKLAAAEQARDVIVAETAGQQTARVEHPPAEEGVIAAKRAPAKGAGSNERHYGHRVLRLNRK